MADHLSTIPYASRAFQSIASKINAYLADPENRDLHKELGLIYPPGRPQTFQERKKATDTARKIHALRRAGKPWSQIESTLGMERRTLERIYKRHLPRLEKEEMLAPVDRAMREVLRELRQEHFRELRRERPESS